MSNQRVNHCDSPWIIVREHLAKVVDFGEPECRVIAQLRQEVADHRGLYVGLQRDCCRPCPKILEIDRRKDVLSPAPSAMLAISSLFERESGSLPSGCIATNRFHVFTCRILGERFATRTEQIFISSRVKFLRERNQKSKAINLCCLQSSFKFD